HGTLECGARRESGPRPIATLFGWREVEKGVKRALPHTQRKGYVFIRHKRRHTQAVQGATALRPCPLGVPREALRHEEASDREVTAPRPLEPHDLPVVVDPHLIHGHHHATQRWRGCASTDHPRRGADPLGMANAAGECPPSTDPVAALDGDRLATGHK